MAGPWDDLDPEREPEAREEPGPRWGPDPPAAREPRAAARPAGGDPSRPRGREVRATVAFLRGLTRRCPRCGGGRLFASWFRIRPACPRCGLRLEREEGGFLGAMTVNYVVTAVLWLALLIVWLIVDLPDVNVAALTVASICVALLVPLLFWPFSKTIWAVVDFLVWRTDPDYPSSEAAHRAGGNGGRP